MSEVLMIPLKITIVIFMAGNLLDLGLRLDLKAALKGLRDVRFVTLSLLWAFVLCPALAWGLTQVIPLSKPYAMGLILLGLTPLCAAASHGGGQGTRRLELRRDIHSACVSRHRN
jgi:BASS family bile acid:Na+ symporter